jgi:hypothetical protein
MLICQTPQSRSVLSPLCPDLQGKIGAKSPDMQTKNRMDYGWCWTSEDAESELERSPDYIGQDPYMKRQLGRGPRIFALLKARDRPAARRFLTIPSAAAI